MYGQNYGSFPQNNVDKTTPFVYDFGLVDALGFERHESPSSEIWAMALLVGHKSSK